MSIHTRSFVPVAALVAFGAVPSFVRCQERAPDLEAPVLLHVAAAVEQAHVAHPRVDDAASERALARLLDMLDPARMWFVAEDIQAFEGRRHDLDDMMFEADPGFVREVYDRYGVRMAEVVADIEELLAKPFDFEKDETFPVRPDKQPWAVDRAERRDRWRRRLKLDTLRLEQNLEPEKVRERLLRRYRRQLERMQELRDIEVTALLARAMLSAFDPHSNYMPPRDKEDFDIHLRLRYQGIGAVLVADDGIPTVRQVFPGSAAALSEKVHPGDKILAVGQGDEGDMVDVVGMRLDDTVRLIRGPNGTSVRLLMELAEGGDRQTLTLVRAPAELTEAAAKGDVYDVGEDRSHRVGVVDLPSFYGGEGGRSASADIRKILGDFKDQGVEVAVLDLRSNGGGLLPEAVDVTGLFIDRGPVVQVASRRRSRVLEDDDRGLAWDGPLIVLTDIHSASASEIVAGAVQDYRRGLVIGSPTHGKGTVQQVASLSRRDAADDLGALALTVQQFYRPDGISTQLVGVRPDIRLPSTQDVIGEREGDLPQALPAAHVEAVPHDDYRMVDDSIVDRLIALSEARRREDAGFQRLDRTIALLRKRELRTGMPVSRAGYEADLEEVRQLREDAPAEGAAVDEADGEATAKEEEEDVSRLDRDLWLRETCAIALDYAAQLADRAVSLRRR